MADFFNKLRVVKICRLIPRVEEDSRPLPDIRPGKVVLEKSDRLAGARSLSLRAWLSRCQLFGPGPSPLPQSRASSVQRRLVEDTVQYRA
jgi:hypothetical protein